MKIRHARNANRELTSQDHALMSQDAKVPISSMVRRSVSVAIQPNTSNITLQPKSVNARQVSTYPNQRPNALKSVEMEPISICNVTMATKSTEMVALINAKFRTISNALQILENCHPVL
jgi:hypothetical protein